MSFYFFDFHYFPLLSLKTSWKYHAKF